jgi:hypothetical protein
MLTVFVYMPRCGGKTTSSVLFRRAARGREAGGCLDLEVLFPDWDVEMDWWEVDGLGSVWLLEGLPSGSTGPISKYVSLFLVTHVV